MGNAKRSAAVRRRAVVTPLAIERSLRVLGVQPGGVLLVHSSLSSLGYVLHGVQGVLLALRNALGEEGTIVVPTFTGEFSDPACWIEPALPQDLWESVREGMPLFHPRRSLPSLMGQISLAVLMESESRRSHHPLASFAALGPRAAEITFEHDLGDPFGPRTPLGRARELGAQVLLLGVDQSRNSAMLHAQALADVPELRTNKGSFLAEVDGERRWVVPSRLGECTEGFPKIEDELVERGLVRVGLIGDATCRLMTMRPLVSSVEYMLRNDPSIVRCDRPDCLQCHP
jgi:aminoglycoside 3-N-acetyltransferase